MKSFQHSECNCKEHMLSCIYIYVYIYIYALYFTIFQYHRRSCILQYIDGNFQAYGGYESQAYLTNIYIYIYIYIFCV